MFIRTHKKSNVRFCEFLNVFSIKISNLILCKYIYISSTKVSIVMHCEFFKVFSIRIANAMIAIRAFFLSVR